MACTTLASEPKTLCSLRRVSFLLAQRLGDRPCHHFTKCAHRWIVVCALMPNESNLGNELRHRSGNYAQPKSLSKKFDQGRRNGRHKIRAGYDEGSGNKVRHGHRNPRVDSEPHVGLRELTISAAG
jgi:hypothetical protein